MTRGLGIRRLAALLLSALIVIAPSTVFAEQPFYGGRDWYASVYGMLGVPNADADGQKLGGGGTLSAGFRFSRWYSLEVGGEYAHQFSYDRGTGPVRCSSGSGGGSDYFMAWQATAGGRVYFTESLVQPFLLGHLGFMQTRDRGGGRSCKGNGMIARLGGGLEVFVSNGVAVSLLGAYVLPTTGGARDHDYVSVGFGLTWY